MNDPTLKPFAATCGRWVDFRPGCRTHATSVRASTEEIARFTAIFGETLALLVYGCAVHRKPLDYIGAEPNVAHGGTT